MPTYFNPPLSQKQVDIVNNRSRYLLVNGPKKCGKTIGNLHRLVKLAYETDRGRWAVFAKTIKEAKDGGVWSDLTDVILPIWLNGNMGMELVTPPKVDGQSRQMYLEISNKYHNKSRISLNSLDYDGDIEKICKGKRYSGVYFSELSKFKSRMVFDISIDALRCVHLDYGQHFWMADTNPSDEGEDSWIYKLFYGERCQEDHTDPEFRNDLALIEVGIPDNPFLSEREVNNLVATFRHDPDLYNRYIKGLWTKASTDSLFSDVFKPEIHVVGDVSSPHEEDWELLLPEENCTELLTGWDLGQRNHAVVIAEPYKPPTGEPIVYKVIDEVVLLGVTMSLGDVLEMVMERLQFWENFIGRPISYRHWSDKSALDSFRPIASLYDAQFIYKASGGKITLQGAPKFKDSVRQRVDTVRRLLFDDRLLVSAKCQNVIQMLRSLPPGKGASCVSKTTPHRHVNDSLSYLLIAESPIDLMPSGPEPRSGRVTLMR